MRSSFGDWLQRLKLKAGVFLLTLKVRKPTPLNRTYLHQINQVCEDFKALERSSNQQILNININSTNSQRYQTLKAVHGLQDARIDFSSLNSAEYTNSLKLQQSIAHEQSKQLIGEIQKPTEYYQGEVKIEATFRDLGENSPNAQLNLETQESRPHPITIDQKEYVNIRHILPQDSIDTSQLVSYNTSNLMSHLSLNNNTQFATITPASGTVSRPSQNSRAERIRKVRNKSGFNTTSSNLQVQNKKDQAMYQHYLKHPYNQPVAVINQGLNVSETRPFKIKMKNIKIKGQHSSKNYEEKDCHKSPQHSKLLKVINQSNAISNDQTLSYNSLGGNPVTKNPSQILSNRKQKQMQQSLMTTQNMDTLSQPLTALGVSSLDAPLPNQIQSSVTSAGNTSKLEKMIKDMIVSDKGRESTAQTAIRLDAQFPQNKQKQNLTQMGGLNMQDFHQITLSGPSAENINLSSFLDTQIKPNHQKPSQTLRFQGHFPAQGGHPNNKQNSSQVFYKDEPSFLNMNQFQRTLVAQRQDIQAYQEMEREKMELERRIKERYNILKRQQKRDGSTLPEDIIAYQRLISNSNLRPSTKRTEYQPYHQTTQSLNLMRGVGSGSVSKTSRRNKRSNQTAFNPSQVEFYSGRITSMKGNSNSILNQSPSLFNKTSKLNIHGSQQTQLNMLMNSGGQNASILSGATDETAAQNLNSSIATYSMNISQPNINPSTSPDREGSLENRNQPQKNGWMSIQVQGGGGGYSNTKVVLSNKKINRIQRKKIVIHDNFSTLQREARDLTPNRYFEQSSRIMNNGLGNTRLGPGNYSQLRQRPRIPSQQSNLRSVSSAQRHHRTKSVGTAQRMRSILPANATQFYQIQQCKGGNQAQNLRRDDQRSLDSKTAQQNNRFHSLSPPRTQEKEGDQSPLQFQKSLVEEAMEQRQSQQPIAIESAQFANLLHDGTPKINMLSEEFRMDRNRLNKSRREVRQDLSMNLNNTAISIGSGQVNGLMLGGVTNSSVNNQNSVNFNIRQKLNFRYIPDEDTQRYKSLESEREDINLEDSIQNQNLVFSQNMKNDNVVIQNRNIKLEENESFGIPINDQDKVNAQTLTEEEEGEEIVDHIKIENGQIIVSDSIAMNSSMPLDQINEILSGHNIEAQDILGPTQIESAFNTPNAKQNFVFSSNIINAKDIRSKNQWREQEATGSDSAGMSKTTLSTQHPLMSGVAQGTGNLFHQFTNQSKIPENGKLLSYQRGRFSSDSSFLKIRYASNNHNQAQQAPNLQNFSKTNMNINSKQNQFGSNSNQPANHGAGFVKHSTAMDGEESQCKFEGDYENREEHNSHHPIISLSTFNQKIRGGMSTGEDAIHHHLHRNSYGNSVQIGINRLSWVHNGLKASAVGLGIRVGSVGQIQEVEEQVEDEESKRSHRNALNMSDEVRSSHSAGQEIKSCQDEADIAQCSSKLTEKTPATQGIQANDYGESDQNLAKKKLISASISMQRNDNVIPQINSGSSGYNRYALKKQINDNSSNDSIVMSSSRMQTSGKQKSSQKNRQNYVDGGSFEIVESKCNLLNSNRTDCSDPFEVQLKDSRLNQNNKGLSKDMHRRMSLIRSGQQQIPQSNNPIHKFNQAIPNNCQWVQDHDSDNFKVQLDSSPGSNNPKGQLLHSDDEIDIRRGLEPSTYRSLNPREPELLRQSTHSLLGFNRGNQENMPEGEDFVQLLGNEERYREFTNAQINHNKIPKNINNIQQQDSVSKQMIIDDCVDDELRAQLDVDFLQNQDLIEVIDDVTENTDPPSRLVKLNLDSYENFLKNADNFTLRGVARE